MNGFKAGDWVVNEYGTTVQLTISHYTGVSKKTKGYFDTITLWIPQKDEWCVFWDNDDSEYKVAKYGTVIINSTGYYDGMYNKEHGWHNIKPLKYLEGLNNA